MKNEYVFACAAWLFACASVGCSSSANGGGDSQSPPPSGDGSAPDCAGAFARIDAKYALDATFSGIGGFTVDGAGMVFGLIPDPRQINDVTSIPYLIQTGTLTGATSTVYTYPSHAVMASVRADAASIYFLAHGYQIDQSIFRMPRSGGAPQVVYTPTQGAIADFVMDDQNVYFAEGESIFAVPKAGGAPKTLAERKGAQIHDLAIDAGRLYWGEQPFGTIGDAETAMWSVGPKDTTPASFGTVPKDLAINQIGASGDILVFSTIDTSANSRIYTMARGGAPVKIDEGGNPMAIDGGDVYFNTDAGLKRMPVAGGTGAVITSGIVPYMSAIALTPTEVFYATETCIFRHPK